MNRCTALIALALALPIAAQEMPTATAEHLKLAQSTGVWDAVIVMNNEAGKPTKSTGTSVRQQPLGEFWVLEVFQAELMGQSFRGQGTTGYDPVKKKYVSTWVDSMSPSLLVLEGNYDATGKILTMEGMGPGMDGTPVMQKMVTTDKDANTQVFQMFVAGPDDKDMLMMTITYTRRLKVMDNVPGKGGIEQAPKKGEPVKKAAAAKKDAPK